MNAARLKDIAEALEMKVEELFEKDQAPAVNSLIHATDKDTIRMLRAYGRIKDQVTQRQTVTLIEAFAAGQG